MATLLGALLSLGTLATSNELVVMQAAGFACLQIIISIMKTAMPLVVLTMIIEEWVAPAAEQWRVTIGQKNYWPFANSDRSWFMGQIW